MSRTFFILCLLNLFVVSVSLAQQPTGDVLATAKGLTFRSSDLSTEGQQLYSQMPTLIAQNRKRIFDRMIFEMLVGFEAAARKTTTQAIEKEITAKLGEPTNERIKAVYEANRQTIGNRSIDEVKPQIVSYLRREDDEKAIGEFFVSLKTKYKFTAGKDVNAAQLKPADVLATVNAKPVTAGEFETKNKIELYDFRANLNEQILADLEDAILNSLIEAEAKSENIDAGSLIAREVTNKLKDYSEKERIEFETALKTRLFRKYDVKVLLHSPAPLVLNVSADDDPYIGNANAKVTVIAFVDFQCSACAAVSPVLKRVISEFGSDVRIVYRDFPLMQVHENGFLAALAGNAAKNQGKFFEMVDLMYRNQDALVLESLKKYAGELGMNVAKFESDLKSEAVASEVRKDMADGDALGVNGTPTIFVNGVKIYRLSAEKFRAAIETALKR
ncbi:MAG: DsbA family protein [Pyrinomonadaceae bacterium]